MRIAILVLLATTAARADTLVAADAKRTLFVDRITSAGIEAVYDEPRGFRDVPGGDTRYLVDCKTAAAAPHPLGDGRWLDGDTLRKPDGSAAGKLRGSGDLAIARSTECAAAQLWYKRDMFRR